MHTYSSLKRVATTGAAVLAAALLLRYGALEAGVFPLDCDTGGNAGALCAAKWVLVQSFLHARLGWLSLALGAAAFIGRRRALAWGGWLSGVAGLVLYSFDPAAIGALLSLLVLARDAQRRRGEQQAGREPRDRLGVRGLG